MQLIDKEAKVNIHEVLWEIEHWNDLLPYTWNTRDYMDTLHNKISSLPTYGEWISVEERLPENEQNVLWTFKNSCWKSRVIRCFYARKFQVEIYDDPYDFWEWNEEKDEYYIPEWWYESNEYDEVNYAISDEITHWQPLPLPPSN